MHSRSAIIVMYHYVWPDEKPVPGGIRPMRVSEVERQLDWLAERYAIVGPAEFLASYRDLADRPPCLLTFDDGTRDHAEVATPILARRGLNGLFFIPTGPAERGLMPLTHAVHWLLGQDEEKVWSAFQRYAKEHLTGELALGTRNEAKRIYHYEPERRARIKYAANMALSPEHTERIVEKLVTAAGRSMADLAKEWFASPEQLRQMHQTGMTLGMHGVTHRSLQTLGAEGIRQEIEQCASFLTSITGTAPTWWACPFGGSGAAQETVSAMNESLRALAIRGAVTTRAASVSPDDHSLALPRIDCIQLPPRKKID
jgi:peptidoglycan/xylan/chitin deacetylase (PgdA/CDA1 family)